VSVYGQNVFIREEVSVWYNKFKDGRTGLNDNPEEHGGRTKSSRSDENCVIVEGLIREDRRAKVRETLSKSNFAIVNNPWKRTMP
jgi:hypothetical protein